VPRPPSIPAMILNFFGLKVIPRYFWRVLLHSAGRITAEEKTFIRSPNMPRCSWRARICLAIYAGVIGLRDLPAQHSAADVYRAADTIRSWLTQIYGNTPACRPRGNVLDHRLNCRTMYMNPIIATSTGT